jgi:sec-independent protein translocase protein TatA
VTFLLGFGSALENPFVWVIILVVALLVFGRRLPEVGKNLGQTLVEFKKGLKHVTDEVEPLKKDVESVKKEITESVKKELTDAPHNDKPAPGAPT